MYLVCPLSLLHTYIPFIRVYFASSFPSACLVTLVPYAVARSSLTVEPRIASLGHLVLLLPFFLSPLPELVSNALRFL